MPHIVINGSFSRLDDVTGCLICPECCETHDKDNPLCLLPNCEPQNIKPECRKPNCPDCCLDPIPCKDLSCLKPECLICPKCCETHDKDNPSCLTPNCTPQNIKPECRTPAAAGGCPDCCYWPAPCKLIDCKPSCHAPTCPNCCLDNSCGMRPWDPICNICKPPPCPECCKDFSCPQPPFPGARTSSICGSIECRCPECCYNHRLQCNAAQRKLCIRNKCGMNWPGK